MADGHGAGGASTARAVTCGMRQIVSTVVRKRPYFATNRVVASPPAAKLALAA